MGTSCTDQRGGGSVMDEKEKKFHETIISISMIHASHQSARALRGRPGAALASDFVFTSIVVLFGINFFFRSVNSLYLGN